MQRLFAALDIQVEQHFQSMIDPLHSIPVWSPDDEPMLRVKERFANMTAAIGGTVWLSGPSRHHGSLEQFDRHGIAVEYFHHSGPNPSALEQIRDRVMA
jgi:hypothetical protein